ncbi:MAG: alpha amylase N-terminal ig-like domain-containing protein [Bacillota bacterium]
MEEIKIFKNNFKLLVLVLAFMLTISIGINAQAITEPEPGLIEVEFNYEPPIAVDEVYLAGEFNDWNPQGTLMEKDNGVYKVTVYLEPGEYEYKFVINGNNWQTPEDADDYAPDGFGGENAVIKVGEDNDNLEGPGTRGDGEITKELLHHNNNDHRYFNPMSDDRFSFRFQTRKEEVEEVKVHILGERDKKIETLKPFMIYDNGEYYRAVLEIDNDQFSYIFEVIDGSNSYFYGEEIGQEFDQIEPISVDVSESKIFSPPEWTNDAIFYQIFPDRFANGSSDNDPRLIELYKDVDSRYESYIPDWDQGIAVSDDPVLGPDGVVDGDNSIHPQAGYYAYYGGDLLGVEEKIPYLEDLGINTIYFNPIFKASANHRYNTAGFEYIDDSLAYYGDQEKSQEYFVELVEKLDSAGIKVILDGVFNHVGYEHWAFQDIVEHGEDSEYVDWFNIHDFPVIPLYEQSETVEPNYDAWWGYGHLPELNLNNPEVKDYIFEITEKWLDAGIDGWRLDVPMDVKGTNPDFWKEWRKFVKDYDEDIYLTGEVWENAREYLEGDEFDAVMNYRFRDAVYNFTGQASISADEFHNQMMKLFFDYPEQAVYSLQNLLGSHDTQRYLTMLEGDKDRFALSKLIQFTYPGAPMIYYGDEIAMEGGEDPDNRRTMIWEDRGYVSPDNEMRNYVSDLITMRNEYAALRKGTIRLIEINDSDIYGFLREYQDEVILVLINNSDEDKEVRIDSEQINSGYSRVGMDKTTKDNEIELGSSAYPDIYQGGNHLHIDNRLRIDIPALDGAVLKLK